jgi:hypothetical protein
MESDVYPEVGSIKQKTGCFIEMNVVKYSGKIIKIYIFWLRYMRPMWKEVKMDDEACCYFMFMCVAYSGADGVQYTGPFNHST